MAAPLHLQVSEPVLYLIFIQTSVRTAHIFSNRIVVSLNKKLSFRKQMVPPSAHWPLDVYVSDYINFLYQIA